MQSYTIFTDSIQPIPVKDFKEHVQKMHSNDDYLFSEEYSVSPNLCLWEESQPVLVGGVTTCASGRSHNLQEMSVYFWIPIECGAS